jgi:hypothetical protein
MPADRSDPDSNRYQDLTGTRGLATLLNCEKVIAMNMRVGMLLLVLPALAAAQGTVEYG